MANLQGYGTAINMDALFGSQNVSYDGNHIDFDPGVIHLKLSNGDWLSAYGNFGSPGTFVTYSWGGFSAAVPSINSYIYAIQGWNSSQQAYYFTLNNFFISGSQIVNQVNFNFPPSISVTGLVSNIFNGADTFIGSTASDLLRTYGGNDILSGREGNDYLNGGTGSDTMNGGPGDDTLVGESGNDIMSGAAGHDTLFGDSGNDNLNGVDGNDWLEGGSGNDTITGGVGSDTAALSGVRANYVYTRLSATSVRATNTSTGESDVLNTVEVVYFGDGSTGLLSTDDLLFNSQSAFNDQFTGSAGADTFDGLAGNDLFNGNDGDDSLIGGLGNDTINGGAGNDTLLGGAGNDALDGGTGIDVMNGGPGNDTYVVDNPLDQVIESAVAGSGTIDRVSTEISSHTLALNVEQLVYTGAGSFVGTGNASANRITGGAGNDSLFGLSGNDTLIAGAGDDFLDGGLGADRMEGGAGNDIYIVNQLANAVTLAPGDVAFEGATLAADTGGIDAVLSSVNLTLGLNLENLVLTGTAVSGTGNAVSNLIMGNAGNNTLSGLGGDDLLDGGAGNDTLTGGLGTDTAVLSGVESDYVFTRLTASVGGAVRVTHRSTGESELLNTMEVVLFAGDLSSGLLTLDDLLVNSRSAFNDVYNGTAGADSFDGLAGNDTINGAAGNDTLIGGAGNDTIDGGAGEDVMTGGLGNDTYLVDSNQDQVIELAVVGSGTIDRVNTALASHTLALNVEQLLYTGSGEFEGTGNASANKLTGGAGNDSLFGLSGNDTLEGKEGDDRLDGGVGADVLIGGAGDDTFVIDNALDRVVELLGGGEDTIETALASRSLAAVNPTTLAPLYAHVDNLTYTGTGNFVGVGNTLANVLTGGIGNDSLNGGVGNDTLLGNAGNDSLSGVTGNDVLEGGDGNDTLNGGVGNDTLEGGAGSDVFVFNAAKGAANADTIVDFESGIDKLRLENAIFTTLGLPGALAAGAFVEGSVAADASDRLIYDSGSGALYYDADGNGSASAMVLVATLAGSPTLLVTDIQVI